MNTTQEQRDTLQKTVEFDSPFRVLPDGTVENPIEGIWAPEVYHVDGEQHPKDVEVHSDEWETFSVGYTGQWGYNGAVMHASEYLGGRLADDILTTPGVYVVVSVEDLDDHDSPAGWTVLKLKEMTPAEDLCAECRVPEHDTCPLKDGCRCCADTRERMES